MKNAKEFDSRPSNRKRSLVILSFAGMFALVLLLIFDIHRNMSRRTPRDFTRVFVADVNSTVVGRRLSSGKGDYFLQIHYQTPTGRFAPSQLHSLPGGGEWWAIHFDSGGCPNAYNHTNPLKQRTISAEVCNTLNIYRCQQPQTSNMLLPVLVYVNEGSWFGRSDANLHPESTIERLACRGMVVVALNYRMGPYGFMNLADDTTSERHNLALHDIRTALTWVNTNIASFGGHPKHITVMAKGLGAQLVSVLSSSVYNLNNALFHRLVLLSGTGHVPTLFQSSEQSQNAYSASKTFIVASNCATEVQWSAFTNRSLPADQVLAIEQCLGGLSRETIEETEARAQLPAFVRWQLVNQAGIAPNRNRTEEEKVQSLRRPAPPIPVIMGSCHRPNRKGKPLTPNKINSNMRTQIEEELRLRLNSMVDLMALNYSGLVIDHYLKELRQGNLIETPKDSALVEEYVQRAMQKIKFDFLDQGPLLLEAFQRAGHPHPARIYFFDYEVPFALNKSQLDVAAIGEEYYFMNISDPLIELPCIDDLLLNPTPELRNIANATASNIQRNLIAMATENFAQFLANFVTYGDPNIGDDEQMMSVLPEWPPDTAKTGSDRI
ncbi:carboxylesterase family domain-containing protein [Ditylenchus destructor]|nr:carboxylesterase family domain-containing protein [Ditylenchus destructor]